MTSSSISDKNSSITWRKLMPISQDMAAVIIPKPLISLLKIADIDQAWVQEIVTSEGLLLKISEGMPSSHHDDEE